jgi:hypothetical protein
MKIKKLDLPKKYSLHEERPREEFKKYVGMNKISYSQYSSWHSMYKGSYIAQYFLGIEEDSGIFAEFGTKCGEYLEKQDKADLSDKDIEILDSIESPRDAEYEREIVIDLRPFGADAVMQGFIDRTMTVENGYKHITDFKTGAEKKEGFYASDEYWQTRLYAYALDEEGEIVDSCGVILFPRKGNGTEKHPLRLEGEPMHIDTPYVRKDTEKVLKKVAKTCVEISDYYKLYKKFFTNES